MLELVDYIFNNNLAFKQQIVSIYLNFTLLVDFNKSFRAP